METDTEVINRESVRCNVCGDSDLFVDLVDIFRRDLPQMRYTLQLAVLEGDWSAIAGAAHRLKSSLAVLGATCRTTAEQLEIAAKAGDASRIDPVARELERELDAVLPALDAMVRSGAL